MGSWSGGGRQVRYGGYNDVSVESALWKWTCDDRREEEKNRMRLLRSRLVVVSGTKREGGVGSRAVMIDTLHSLLEKQLTRTIAVDREWK